jgi:hypothetical protein
MPDTTTASSLTKLDKLTNGSLEGLHSILSSNDWTNKAQTVLSAGLLVDRIETLFLKERPQFSGSEKSVSDQQSYLKITTEWQKRVPKNCLEVTDREWQTCLTAIKHFVEARKFFGNYHNALLLQAFKLGE